MNDQEKKVQDTQAATEQSEQSAVVTDATASSQNNGATDTAVTQAEKKPRPVTQPVPSEATKVARAQDGVKKDYKTRITVLKEQGRRIPSDVSRKRKNKDHMH